MAIKSGLHDRATIHQAQGVEGVSRPNHSSVHRWSGKITNNHAHRGDAKAPDKFLNKMKGPTISYTYTDHEVPRALEVISKHIHFHIPAVSETGSIKKSEKKGPAPVQKALQPNETQAARGALPSKCRRKGMN